MNDNQSNWLNKSRKERDIFAIINQLDGESRFKLLAYARHTPGIEADRTRAQIVMASLQGHVSFGEMVESMGEAPLDGSGLTIAEFYQRLSQEERNTLINFSE